MEAKSLLDATLPQQPEHARDSKMRRLERRLSWHGRGGRCLPRTGDTGEGRLAR